MRVLVAPDSFKGSTSAGAAAAAIAAGWRDARPLDTVSCLPLADGGEGTLEVLAAAAGQCRWHQADVCGPGSQLVAAAWLELAGQVAVIELARASGLPLLATPDPLGAHSTGTGQLVAAALDGGARRIVLALGGSACTDGGTGALSVLGARFTDAAGRALPRGGGALTGLAEADLTGLRAPPRAGAACLADVRAPLLGPAGAAAAYGPQKGADTAQVAVLEAGLSRLAAVLGGAPAAPGAGAAGGTGYGFAATWGAELIPGADWICRACGFDAALRAADLVITGEGRYDQTSLAGKVTGTVLAAASRARVPAALVTGAIAGPRPHGAWRSVALGELAGGTAAAMAGPDRWLREAGRALSGQVGELTA